LILGRWGLVLFFTKDLKAIKGLSTINARAETIATSRTWREPMKKRRYLIPVNAFYEWPKAGVARRNGEGSPHPCRGAEGGTERA